MLERRGAELFITTSIMVGVQPRYRWIRIKRYLDPIVRRIRYYEIKEATSLFELALWKANLDQASEMTRRSTRGKYRAEVPGPVKETILQYL